MDHNLQLSEEQSMILDTVRKFVQDVAEPHALDHDEHGTFVREGFDGLAELGLLAASVGEDSGGAGLGVLSLVVALEEIARACTSTARVMLVQGGVCGAALEGVAQAGDSLGAILMGESLAAYVGPEWGVVVREADGNIVLDGAATCVTSAGEADVFVVAARLEDGTAALVLTPKDAVRVEPVGKALGFRAAAPAAVHFESAALLAEGLVARGEDAQRSFDRAAIVGQIGGAAIAVGSGQSAIELARKHAGERIAFGKPLASQQAVVHKLVESRRRVEAARHLVWHAGRLFDLGEDAATTACTARLTAVDAAHHAADEAIQILGGYGFTVEYHVERHYRDAKALEVLDGGDFAIREALSAEFAGA